MSEVLKYWSYERAGKISLISRPSDSTRWTKNCSLNKTYQLFDGGRNGTIQAVGLF